MSILVAILGLIFLVVLYFVFLYNNLATMKVRIEEAWSQIDVQLKRRIDLIPNLVDTVRGYADHERGVFEQVSKARSALMNAEGPQEAGQAEGQLEGALKSLFAVAEDYPELKAQENFSQLQEELSDTEDKIAYARQFFNATVKDYNSKIVTFPNNIIANMLGFERKEFFEVDEAERDVPEVDL